MQYQRHHFVWSTWIFFFKHEGKVNKDPVSSLSSLSSLSVTPAFRKWIRTQAIPNHLWWWYFLLKKAPKCLIPSPILQQLGRCTWMALLISCLNTQMKIEPQTAKHRQPRNRNSSNNGITRLLLIVDWEDRRCLFTFLILLKVHSPNCRLPTTPRHSRNSRILRPPLIVDWEDRRCLYTSEQVNFRMSYPFSLIFTSIDSTWITQHAIRATTLCVGDPTHHDQWKSHRKHFVWRCWIFFLQVQTSFRAKKKRDSDGRRACEGVPINGVWQGLYPLQCIQSHCFIIVNETARGPTLQSLKSFRRLLIAAVTVDMEAFWVSSTLCIQAIQYCVTLQKRE